MQSLWMKVSTKCMMQIMLKLKLKNFKTKKYTSNAMQVKQQKLYKLNA